MLLTKHFFLICINWIIYGMFKINESVFICVFKYLMCLFVLYSVAFSESHLLSILVSFYIW